MFFAWVLSFTLLAQREGQKIKILAKIPFFFLCFCESSMKYPPENFNTSILSDPSSQILNSKIDSP